MIQAYFENIHIEIIKEIDAAQSSIKICVAWFTDFEIYQEIVKKKKQGLDIEIIVANHYSNKKSRVDFKTFLQHNGKVSYIGKNNGGAKDKFMHNKFCIIDSQTIITGSYNWSFKARMNEENILIIKEEPIVTAQFIQKFKEINPGFGLAIKDNKVTLLPIEKIMAKWEKLPTQEITQKPKKKSSMASQIFDKF